MKNLLLSAAALVILSAPVAMAQDQNGNDQPKQERANRGDKPDRSGDQTNGPNGGGMQGPGNMGGPGGGNAQDRDNAKDRDANDNRDNNKANDRNNGPDKKVVVHKTVDRNIIMKVRANITAPRKFHAARAYVRPAGWYEHRWTYGERLPRNFFASDFWITDYLAYGLIAPWDGYEWVRYGDDALLIDVDTGEVIRVEYGLFY
jgi:Ni/Co efflux regulator RcnB